MSAGNMCIFYALSLFTKLKCNICIVSRNLFLLLTTKSSISYHLCHFSHYMVYHVSATPIVLPMTLPMTYYTSFYDISGFNTVVPRCTSTMPATRFDMHISPVVYNTGYRFLHSARVDSCSSNSPGKILC